MSWWYESFTNACFPNCISGTIAERPPSAQRGAQRLAGKGQKPSCWPDVRRTRAKRSAEMSVEELMAEVRHQTRLVAGVAPTSPHRCFMQLARVAVTAPSRAASPSTVWPPTIAAISSSSSETSRNARSASHERG